MLGVLLIACSAPSPRATIPLGHLGQPLGTWLHIECVRDAHGKVGPHDVVIDRIDGRTCEPPIAMRIENLAIPAGERVLAAGYETGRWIGVPLAVAEAEGIPLSQAGWQFAHAFVVTSVQAPDAVVRAAREAGIGAR